MSHSAVVLPSPSFGRVKVLSQASVAGQPVPGVVPAPASIAGLPVLRALVSTPSVAPLELSTARLGSVPVTLPVVVPPMVHPVVSSMRLWPSVEPTVPLQSGSVAADPLAMMVLLIATEPPTCSRLPPAQQRSVTELFENVTLLSVE